jgi:hypothetical protein
MERKVIFLSKVFLSCLQFLFPVLAILCLLTSLGGPYTIQISIGLLVIGFLFSIYEKLILWGLINLSLTIFIIFGAVIIFFVMVASGV